MRSTTNVVERVEREEDEDDDGENGKPRVAVSAPEVAHCEKCLAHAALLGVAVERPVSRIRSRPNSVSSNLNRIFSTP